MTKLIATSAKAVTELVSFSPVPFTGFLASAMNRIRTRPVKDLLRQTSFAPLPTLSFSPQVPAVRGHSVLKISRNESAGRLNVPSRARASAIPDRSR